MKILISDIPEEGLKIDINEMPDTEAVRLLSFVKGELSITKVGPELVISGDINAMAELECSRCLKHYKSGIDVSVNVMYHPLDELKDESKHEIREDELDMGFYSGNEFDVSELLKEQLVLNIPMKPLCDEACKGICPKCGIDLNINGCNCNLDSVDPRLEVLRKLLRKEQ